MHPVEVLHDDLAYELLQELAPSTCEQYPEASRSLCNRLGGLPLAVELVGAYLSASSQRYFKTQQRQGLASMTDPGQRLEQASRRLGDLSQQEQTLQEVIHLSLDDLDSGPQQAFSVLGAFAPKPEWFDLDAAKAVTQADEAVLGVLLSRNLVEIDDQERLALHQVLADVASTRTPAEAVERHAAHYLALINSDREAWQRIQALYGQAVWAAEHAPPEDKAHGFLAFMWPLWKRMRALYGVCVAMARKCAAAHIRSYAESMNMRSPHH